MKGKPNDSLSKEIVVYAFAHCETWLEDYAKSHQLPQYELTERVARLLLAQTSGQVLGTLDHMSALRRETAKVYKTPREVAVVKRTYRKAQIASPNAPKVGQEWRSKYGKPHWTQTPAGKKRLAKHMRYMRRRRLEKLGKA